MQPVSAPNNDARKSKTRFLLRLEAETGIAGVHMLRALLKRLLRDHDFRCIDLRETEDAAPTTQSDEDGLI
jgi:hypothetical protein